VPEGRDLLLTHDAARYADEMFWRDTRTELVMGPGSWGWVERSYASTRSLERPGVLEAIKTPVFLVGTSNDKLVSYAAIKRAARRMPKAELLTFGKEARHEVLREVDAVRDPILKAIDEFLDRAAPPRN
jgi:lysophospholipase